MASRRLVLSLLLAKVATQDCTVPGSNIRALQNALTRIKARNAYQCTTNTDMSIWDLGGTPAFHNVPPFSAAVVSLLAPVYDCPWTLERSNYVSELNFDGGKWTCGLKELSDSGQPCVVYSFGSNADSLFEDHVRRTSPPARFISSTQTRRRHRNLRRRVMCSTNWAFAAQQQKQKELGFRAIQSGASCGISITLTSTS